MLIVLGIAFWPGVLFFFYTLKLSCFLLISLVFILWVVWKGWRNGIIARKKWGDLIALIFPFLFPC